MATLITLIIVGFLLIILEVFVVPGTTVVGFAGFICILIAIYWGFKFEEAYIGWITLISSGVLGYALYRFFTNSTYSKTMQLETVVGEKIDLVDNKVQVADTGKTISRLNPVGKAKINNEIFEVKSIDGFVEEQKEIVVLEVVKNTINVQQLKS